MKNKLYTLRTPKTFADCEEGGFNEARPCQFEECKYRISHSGKCVIVDFANHRGYSIQEVAKELGTTENAIMQTEKRAFAKLRKFPHLKVLLEP